MTLSDKFLSFIIFDLDGTLIELSNDENSAYIDALKAASGGEFDTDWGRYPVRTDLGVAKQVFEEMHSYVEFTGWFDNFKSDYLERLKKVLEASDFRSMPIDGAYETLEYLKRQKYCRVGLATANLRDAAEMRLSKAGLGKMFEFAAFADDGRTKSEILAHAISLSDDFDTGNIIFVGDQVPDVIAAVSCGVNFIGVATTLEKEKKMRDAGCTKFACNLRMDEAFGNYISEFLL